MNNIINADAWARSRIDINFTEGKLNRTVKKQLKSNQRWLNSIIENSVHIPPTSTFSEIFAPAHASGRPIYLVTAHWGSYFQSLVEIAATFPSPARFAVVRGHPWTGIDEQLLWASLNNASAKSIRVFTLSNLNPVALFKYLRSGAHAIFLYDVDSSYGRALPIHFFGQKLFIGAGWIDIAYTNRAIIAIISPRSINQNTTRLFNVLDSQSHSSLEQFRQSCAVSIAAHLETLVKEDINVWFKWQEFGKFLSGK